MRICYVSHSDAHFTEPYVDFFSGRGDEIHLISLVKKGLSNAINHHPIEKDFDPEKTTWGYLWVIPKVRRVIRQIKPDILHAHYLTSNGLMATMSGYHPLVVSARGSDVYQSLGNPIRRRLIRFTMNRADLVNPVSADLEKCILSLGIAPEKILRLTQGIESLRFIVDRSTRRPGPLRFVCTRKLFPLYQCDQIVAALDELAKRGADFECTFAAAGPEEPALREQVKQAGLEDRVRFLGGFNQNELPAILADGDIYVSASQWDGTSPALLEAMASGAFPVVSDIPANREWLTGKEDGLLFPVSHMEQLLACLERAMQDEPLRQGAVERNRRQVAARGDREANMNTMASHYEQLVAAYS